MITHRELIDNAAAAYDAGELIAQNPTSGLSKVMVNRGGCVCALGASIPKEKREPDLVSGRLDIPFGTPLAEFATELMQAHDQWDTANRLGGDVDGARRRFLSMIGR